MFSFRLGGKGALDYFSCLSALQPVFSRLACGDSPSRRGPPNANMPTFYAEHFVGELALVQGNSLQDNSSCQEYRRRHWPGDQRDPNLSKTLPLKVRLKVFLSKLCNKIYVYRCKCAMASIHVPCAALPGCEFRRRVHDQFGQRSTVSR